LRTNKKLMHWKRKPQTSFVKFLELQLKGSVSPLFRI
ncbi:hypothetical protein Y032_0750g2037, partial [Ancylostoma ceylanicum]